jgi:hypothetical protein
MNAIDLLCDDGSGKRNTTAFLLENLNKLSQILNSANGWHINDIAKYHEDIEFLNFCRLELFPNMTFEIARGEIKSLKGMIVNLSSTVEYSKFLFDQGHENVIPKYFNNNLIESTFGQLTYRTKKPDSQQFRQSLKAISVTQYENPVRGSSYNYQESEEISSSSANFLPLLKEYAERENEKISDGIEDQTFIVVDMNGGISSCDELSDYASFLKLITTIVESNNKLTDSCDTCAILISNVSDVSSSAWNFFRKLEFIFKEMLNVLSLGHQDFEENFILNCSQINDFDHCLPIQEAFASAYLKCRSRMVFTRREKHRVNKFSSKSNSK